jgi:hypothetical protein
MHPYRDDADAVQQTADFGRLVHECRYLLENEPGVFND